jgi:hypothetical protein
MQIAKPKVYISSTIYDFRDLRSALKFWLEGLGYEVLLSEFNDFTKPIDENSYAACLHTVEQCSHFILLIGARVGGLYNVEQRVSITRMEYRTAYNLVRRRKLKLATFVRADLWSIKEDRNALRELLNTDYRVQKDLNETDIKGILNHSSALINDAETIFEFLREVGRVDEMKKAIAGEEDFPLGNWIHQFTSFGEIIDALKVMFGVEYQLSKVALKINLKRELLQNLIAMTGKNTKDGRVYLNTLWADHARRTFQGEHDEETSYPAKYLKWLGGYLIARTSAEKLITQFLDQALLSGEFLSYDVEENLYKSSAIHEALYKLRENIKRLRLLEAPLYEEQRYKLIARFSPKDNPIMRTDSLVSVENGDLIPTFAFYDCEKNISDLCVAIIKALEGDESRLRAVELRLTSPVQSSAEGIQKETPTLEDISVWMGFE